MSFFNWFCGDPTAYGDPEVNERPVYERHVDSLISRDTCYINLVSTIPHLVFIVVSSLLLICLACTKYRGLKSPLLHKFPYHTVRWIFLLIFIFICACSIAEGVITDFTYHSVSTTQPHLFIPAIIALWATVMSLVHYQHSENWQVPILSVVSLIYWCLALIGELVKLWNHHRGEANTIEQIFIFRYDVGLLSSFVYLAMIVLELKVLSLTKILLECNSPDPSMRYYENYVNTLSYALFYWINWLLKLGNHHPLEMKDLGLLPDVHRTNTNYQKMRTVFKKETDKAVMNNREPSLWMVYLKTFPREIFVTFLSKLIPDTLVYVLPLSLDVMTSYVESLERGDIKEITPHYITTREFFTNVYVLAVLFSFAAFTQFFLLQVHFYECSVLGIHIRSGLQALVYEKSIQIANLAGGTITVGTLTNHISTDAISLLDFAQTLHLTWSIPIRIILVVSLLYLYVGSSAFIGLLSIILLVPLQAIIAHKLSVHQKKASEISDDRLKKSSEMFLGIKLLKLYGWEDTFRNMIEAVRFKEIKSILRFNMQFANTVCMAFAIPAILSVAIYGTYPFITGKVLTSSVTFTAYVLITMLSDPLFQLPVVLSNMVKALVATKRLKTFFLASETEKATPDVRANGATDAIGMKSITLDHTESSESIAIQITNADFTWDKDSTIPILKNINVSIPKGNLVMIVGAVGSGKSSLLSAIIKEMTTLRGNIHFHKDNCKVAYTAQQAWIINASIRDNILFGEPFNKQRYRKVIDACALNVDIGLLPAGDRTEIGEKGINLSGGQKQRVSVARAMYSSKDIILMDDPLSALDVHVGDHLFKEGIRGMLLEDKRTVVLVTHQLQHLKQADLILAMEDGVIVHQGTFDDITAREPTMFAECNFSEDSTPESESDERNEQKEMQEQLRQKILDDEICKDIKDQARKRSVRTSVSSATGDLIEAEELERGAVSNQVYFYLLKSIGYPMVIAFFISRMLQECFNIYRVFWLAQWADAAVVTLNSTTGRVDTVYYIAGYCGISLAVMISSALMGYSAVIAFYLGAKNIHISLIRNIFRSPMRFFDTTPAGRVLNRFSSDTQVIDTKIVVTLIALVYYALTLPAAFIAISVVTPIFIVEVLPILIIYYFLQRYFIRSSRELQRLDSTSKSPVFAHYSETLGGLSTIKAYGEEDRFFNIMMEKIDTNNATFLYLKAAYGWIGSQLNLLSFAILLMASLTTMITADTVGLSSSYVGLSLTYAVAITYLLYSFLKYSAETEIQMNAVERVSHYTQLVNEDPTGQEPPDNWPHRGEIKMKDIYVRYAADLPAVLKAVNLLIRPREKVGICGRTGSGKSSLTLSLFRLIDTYQGQIIIDGINIAKLPLSVLRRRLSIIPQDPVLFTGTVRQNLDPEGVLNDAQLWDALETAQLKTVVAELESGLEYEVSEGGENFSVGQRQLFCLARAFLRNSRILIMDEATASIDYETEKVLQEVVSSAFREKTVITIAHRVSTILNSDSIVVLNAGEIIEHDTPQTLLANESSMFASLVQANK